MGNSKPFVPKLGSARPRLSAALQAAALQQFSSDSQPQPKGKIPAQSKAKGKITSALLNLKGAF